ncbi:MAG: choice-of-anchor L domain-containing protein [Saprospiraceae bacterium]|nr:choice-of-anchor L domain-containing protein [Saprospiraceae bacterium]
MKFKPPISERLLCLFFALAAVPVFAQRSFSVQLNGTRTRAPLQLPEGVSRVSVCHLTPGNTYQIVAGGAFYGQKTTLELALDPAVADQLQVLPAEPQNLRFIAAAGCAELLLKASGGARTGEIPAMLSVFCENCLSGEVLPSKTVAVPDAPNMTVQQGILPLSLVQNTLIGGDCFEVSNVTSFGPANAFSTFGNGSSSIGIESGIVLSTARGSFLPGPNDENGGIDVGTGFNINSANDPNLATLTTGDQWDVVKLEFDFTPTSNTVQFDYVFGSEEYCEFVGQGFNDVFGFFISGPGISGTQNLAVIPNTNTPITVNNINQFANNQYFVANDFLCLPFLPYNPADCQLDGWTDVFTATANVIPCSTYHIKLAIADVFDGGWSSAVFLRANSFNAGGAASAAAIYPANLNAAPEGCTPGQIRFSRDNNDTSTPLEIHFTVSGTATPGVDYGAITSPVVIPAGQTEVFVPINAPDDGIVEGPETILLLLDNPCSCDQAEAQFLIQDALATLSVDLPDLSLCSGSTAVLTPVITDGVPPYSYLWGGGQITPSIQVDSAGVYTLQVTDACGALAAATSTVSYAPSVELTTNIALCAGSSIEIDGIIYSGPATLVDTFPGLNGACDTISRLVLTEVPVPALTDTIVFCTGDSILVNGAYYSGSATVLDTLVGQNGGCDTLLTFVLQVLERPTLFDTLYFCPGGSVQIGNVSYSSPGTVIDTLPGQNGNCDTTVTYTLLLLPQPTRSETLSLCPGASVTIGGTKYSAPATVTETRAGTGGACDTLVTYTLLLLPQPTRSETLSLCPGASVTIGGTKYTAPATVTETRVGTGGACDTIVTYTLLLLPQPTRSETVSFCPGTSVTIGGTAYTQPGTVVLTQPGSGGACDTIVTYTLVFSTPAPSTVKVLCPPSIAQTVGGPTNITYAPPTATSDCPCPGMTLQLSSGLPSGSSFPTGLTKVCYTATDACGNTASCCFEVRLEETTACDIKDIGCLKFELLSITRDPADNRSYRIRVTNKCSAPLVYAAFQLPKGQTALEPANGSVYTAPSGRQYLVRNPNATPFHSIRFTSFSDPIASGESDIFEYTLPPQIKPTYIQVIGRVAEQTYYEAYLNTFNCPIGITPGPRESQVAEGFAPAAQLFPNPTDGRLFADLSAWAGEALQVQVFDSRGARVQQERLRAETEPQEIQLPTALADGLYFLHVQTPAGERQVLRFVVQR